MSNELEFSISIKRLPAPSETLKLPVGESDLLTAAQACNVKAFNNLEATYKFKRWRKHGVSVFCNFKAEIEQECISTLEPISTRIEERFERQFLPEQSSDYKSPEIIDGEMILDPEAADFPDLIEGDEINLWDILIEEMILVINPFPRADSINENSDVLADQDPDQTAEPTHRPFSDLKTLITEKKSNK